MDERETELCLVERLIGKTRSRVLGDIIYAYYSMGYEVAGHFCTAIILHVSRLLLKAYFFESSLRADVQRSLHLLDQGQSRQKKQARQRVRQCRAISQVYTVTISFVKSRLVYMYECSFSTSVLHFGELVLS
jgi:hypothetical protein